MVQSTFAKMVLCGLAGCGVLLGSDGVAGLRLQAEDALNVTTHLRNTKQSDELVRDTCDGLQFWREEKPFAFGHNGSVPVYFAVLDHSKPMRDQELFVYKTTRRSGIAREQFDKRSWDEKAVNEHLRRNGVTGPGCVAGDKNGILLNAVVVADNSSAESGAEKTAGAIPQAPQAEHSRPAPAPQLETLLKQWRLEPTNAQRLMIKPVIAGLLEQVERVVLAGVVNADINAGNILMPGLASGNLRKVALIDFEVFGMATRVHENYSAVAESGHAAAMMGPAVLGLAFCFGGDRASAAEKRQCRAARDAAAELLQELERAALSGGESPLQLKSPSQTIPEIVRGLKAFVERSEFDFALTVKLMQGEPVDLENWWGNCSFELGNWSLPDLEIDGPAGLVGSPVLTSAIGGGETELFHRDSVFSHLN